jgi:hypothetical protein
MVACATRGDQRRSRRRQGKAQPGIEASDAAVLDAIGESNAKLKDAEHLILELLRKLAPVVASVLSFGLSARADKRVVLQPITAPAIPRSLMEKPPDPKCDIDIPEAGVPPSRLEASRQCYRAAVDDRDARLSGLQSAVRVREKAIAAVARAAKR